jgi:hypothetical protein
MSHRSIAIIKRQVVDSDIEGSQSGNLQIDRKKTNYEYLVIKAENKYKFYDYKSDVINGEFDYSLFKKKVIEFLGFSAKDKFTFNSDPTPYKINEDPRATAYEYELTYEDSQKIATNGEYEWMNSAKLRANYKNWNEEEQTYLLEKDTAFVDVNFSNCFRTDIVNIVKANRNNKLTIFAGAGVSMDSGVPKWKELTDSLQSEIDVNKDDFLEIAQAHFNSRGKKENIEKIKDEIKFGLTSFNLIHKQIIDLQPCHIITTNYDDHFEQVINKANLNYAVIKKDADLPYAKTNSYLVKMHGDIEEKNIVLKQDDYDQYSKQFPLIKGFVEGVFSSQLVLFVGFSFQDPNLKQILRNVKDILREDNQPPYLIHIKSNNKKEEEEQYKRELINQGLKIVEVEEDAVNDFYENQIQEIDKCSLEQLSSTGQIIYKFLKVIEKFDLFTDSLLFGKKIEQQLIASLDRFNGLSSLPIEVLTKISPFTMPKSKFSGKFANAEYNDFNLSVLNETLLHILNPKDEKESNVVIDSTFSNKKTNDAFKLLMRSGIFYINRKLDLSSPIIKLSPNPKRETENCECIKCLLSSYKYDKVLEEFNSNNTKNIFQENDLGDEMLTAYGLMKTGQFILAFYYLEKCKQQARQKQNHIVSFLASYNQWIIRSFVHYFNNRSYSLKDINAIKYKIDQIDLNKIISSLPVDDDVRKTLILIKEDTLLYNVKNKVEYNLVELQKVYDGYQKGRYKVYSGPTYWRNVEMEFYNLVNFYRFNLLFNDEKQYFLDIAHSYIEVMIASFMISQKYDYRLQEFYPFFFQVLIDYGNPKKIFDLFEKYGLQQFTLKNPTEQKQELLEDFYAFCKSGYNETKFFRNELHPNIKFQSALNTSEFFKSKAKRTLNNFLILFCKIELSNDEINKILIEGLNYLSVNETYNAHGEFEYIIEYIKSFSSVFSEANILKIVDYMLSENIWSDALIEPVCRAILDKRGEIKILNEEYYQKILRRTTKSGGWQVDLQDMLPFYMFFEDEQKLKFFELIKDLYLNKKELKHVDPYSRAYNYGIWNPIDNEEFFNGFLSQLYTSTNGLKEYALDENGYEKEVENYSGLNDLNFAIKLVYKHQLFNHEFVNKVFGQINNNMFKWALKPHEWDYSTFDYKWIVAFSYIEEMFVELRKISKLKMKINEQLSEKYNPKVAEVYFKYLS